MKKTIDYMIDVETLGLTEKPIVLEISFVAFDINSGERFPDKSHTIYPSIPDQIKAGFTIDADTVEWWMGDYENMSILLPLLNKANYHSDSLDRFYDLIADLIIDNEDGIQRFWATAPLDYQCLTNLLEASCKGSSKMIPYGQRMCARTIAEVSRMKTGSAEKNSGVHDSYADCLIQIKDLCSNIKF